MAGDRQQGVDVGILDHVTGEATVVMDADLQDDPAHIPELIAKYEQGYDVVYAVRGKRDEPIPLRLAYWAFYRLLSRLSRVAIPTDSGHMDCLWSLMSSMDLRGRLRVF